MPEHNAYIHVTLPNPPNNSVKNDGSTIPIILTFRETNDESSAVMTAITGVDFLVIFSDSQGFTYDIYKVSIVNGVASFNFTATVNHKPETVYIFLNRMLDIITVGADTYNARIVGIMTDPRTIYQRRFMVYST